MNPIIELKKVTKIYPGVKALDNVNFRCCLGEVTALLGENGAGKSTLLNTLFGILQPDEGQYLFDGKQALLNSPHDALAMGISMMHQEVIDVPE
ncbi:MAG: ATP-binding cassette domain-containing protein, partial [Alphaproteobacteria bacterium]